MSVINEMMETSDKSKKRIKVVSPQGGTDRTIYVNDRDSGYRLGDSNDRVYTHSKREVSSSLKDFVRLNLWEKYYEGSYIWYLYSNLKEVVLCMAFFLILISKFI